jgi:pyruvate ferredoxin oxidoreductase delta subunit
MTAKKFPNWRELPIGAEISGGGNSQNYSTGNWSAASIEFLPENCKNCGLCFSACPDSAILKENGKVVGIDREHCKKCGICERVCKFGAIKISGK